MEQSAGECQVVILGRRYPIITIHTRNRTASACLKSGAIVIRVPQRWPEKERQRVHKNLLGRAVKSIARGRWKEGQGGRVRFYDGQEVIAMGKGFRIALVPARRFGSRVSNGRIEVRTVEGHHKKEETASRLVRRRITEAVHGELSTRVHELNRLHFNADIRKISVRDNSSRWGSCSRDGSISLNFRLLFMPQEVLDYVIIHELAHTRYRGHGPRFWALVEKADPHHRESRRWLRENGWSVPATGGNAQGDCAAPQACQPASVDFTDEPY